MILKARIVKPGILGLKKRDLQDCGRTGIHAAGLLWHRQYKKHHFQKYAFAKYRYRRRSKAYERRKHREHPEAEGRPLVFTGESERRAMSAEVVHATATSWDRARAHVVVSGPNLNFHADEATRVSVYEERRLAQEFADRYERRLVAIANQKIVPLEFTVRTG
jgi:hypothetical protein